MSINKELYSRDYSHFICLKIQNGQKIKLLLLNNQQLIKINKKVRDMQMEEKNMKTITIIIIRKQIKKIKTQLIKVKIFCANS